MKQTILEAYSQMKEAGKFSTELFKSSGEAIGWKWNNEGPFHHLVWSNFSPSHADWRMRASVEGDKVKIKNIIFEGNEK